MITEKFAKLPIKRFATASLLALGAGTYTKLSAAQPCGFLAAMDCNDFCQDHGFVAGCSSGAIVASGFQTRQ